MPAMSRGAPRRPIGRLARLADLGAKFLVPGAASLTLLAVVGSSARTVEHDLQLLAPERAAAGGALPVRAQLYAGLHQPKGARLITAEVALELWAPRGRLLARARLRPSFAHSLDAVLALPAGYAGPARLVAHARLDGTRESAERRLELSSAGPLPRAPEPRRPRSLGPLQRFAPGPVRATRTDSLPPDALELAIAGGACVPEQRCVLLLHVGSPAASVRVVASPSVTADAASARPSAETSGVVVLRVVTHGPEAELQVVAERAGAQVAARAYRLAVALGAQAAAEQAVVLDAPALPPLGLLGDERGCIVDAFVEGDWARTGALRDCRGRERAPFAALESGLWRVQLRRDPFAVDMAAVQSLYVRRPHETAAEVLTRLADAALALDPSSALLARRVHADPAPFTADFEATARHLLAQLDAGLLELPAPASSFPRAVARLELERAKLRKLALLALALCALTLGLLVAQRGLLAASQAGDLMAEAGQDAPELERQRLRRVLRVLATVSSLLLAFAAIGVYMLARSHGP
jgi:hypothetical protein